jgi:hypothetical protein
MKHWRKLILTGVLLTALVVLSACNLPSAATQTADDPSLLYTAAAETVSAQLTVVPGATQAVLPSATLPPDGAVNTLPPSATPNPTGTQIATTATNIPVPCNRASFVEDVNYPDDTEVPVSTNFQKTWRLKNTGTCNWDSSYALVFVRGDSMGGPAAQQFTTGSVAPGQLIDVSVNLIAPSTTGTYQGYWQLRNGAGTLFGIGANAQSEIWVKIKAIQPKPTATATQQVTVGIDFVDKGPSAEWRNNTDVIPWGDPASDKDGVVVDLDDFKMENNKTYDHVLATYPPLIDDGILRGKYPSYTVQSGDHFRALLGFRSGCADGKVRFQVIYIENNNEVVFAEWLKICDGNLLNIDQDLASLVGKNLQFMLSVKTEGSFKGDKVLWVNPRIER